MPPMTPPDNHEPSGAADKERADQKTAEELCSTLDTLSLLELDAAADELVQSFQQDLDRVGGVDQHAHGKAIVDGLDHFPDLSIHSVSDNDLRAYVTTRAVELTGKPASLISVSASYHGNPQGTEGTAYDSQHYIRFDMGIGRR